MQLIKHVALALLGLLGACLAETDMNTWGSWKIGRATFYGTDAWSIHSGGCNYGHLSPGEPLGWNVAAMADVNSLYPNGMCGFCVEVACAPIAFSDNYGNWLDRKSVCWDTAASIVVRITDTCPCTYAPNAYSNKRWCCGDMDHFDLSYITFGSLADMKYGVIGIQYRQVPCDYKPYKPAGQSPYANEDSSYNPSAPLPLRDWPEYTHSWLPPMDVFDDNGLTSGWWDASWNTYVVPYSQAKNSGMTQTRGLCASISPNGALSLMNGQSGVFANRKKIGFWMYVGNTGYNGWDAKVADITISISGSKGGCSPMRIWWVKPTAFTPSCTYCGDYWWYWEFHLQGFAGGDPNAAVRPGDFQGCGYNGLYDLNRIEFRNDGFGGWNNKFLCLDSVTLL